MASKSGASSQTVKISGNVSLSDESSAGTSVQFSNRTLQTILNFDVMPQRKLKTAGVYVVPFSGLKLYAGNILPSGIASRAKTPCFSKPSALGTSTQIQPLLKVSLPSLSTSDETAEGAAVLYTLPLCTLGAFIAVPERKIENAICMAGISYAPFNTDFSAAVYVGSHAVSSAPSNRWFRTARYFPDQRLYFLIAEAAFRGTHISASTSNMVSTSPFGGITASTSTTAAYSNGIFTAEAGFFSCDADHFTREGKAVRKTLSAYVHPYVTTQFGTDIVQSLKIGVVVSQECAYSFHHNPVRTLQTDSAAACKYTVGAFALTTGVKASDVTNTENTEYKPSFEAAFYPLLGGRRQQFSLESELTIYPKKESKPNSLTCGVQAKLYYYAHVSADIEQSCTLKKTAQLLHGNGYEPHSFSTKFSVQLQFSGKYGRAIVTFKESFSHTIKDKKNPVLLFYCGYTLYIKP